MSMPSETPATVTDDGRWMLVTGALLAFVAVGAGAFGSHGLRTILSPPMLAVFETGVRYQFIHALALLLCGALAPRLGGRWLTAAAALFAVGVLLFSGSLYALTLIGSRGLGIITPIGGTAWLLGWLALAVAAWRAPRPISG
jgi:uncharacterized membrane protein YgdD (TMEM256/DUF423 family)